MAEVLLGGLATIGGSLGGSEAAKALGLTPNPIGPDTTVPGITKATLQQPSKMDPGFSIAQEDPTMAINYFKQASDKYTSTETQGLGLYTAAMTQAVASSDQGTTDANKALTSNLNPMIANGNTATTQYMNALGLPSTNAAGVTQAPTQTAQQIQSQIQSTPGYQFALSQGTQAAARSGAATGLLNSGNTLAASDTFAQGLANTTYQSYLTNLQPIMSAGNTASGQLASGLSSNYMAQGQNDSQLFGNLGTGVMNAYTNMAQNQYNALQEAGQTTFSATTNNMNAQNQAIEFKMGLDAQQQNNNAQNSNAAAQVQLGYAQLANQQNAQAQYAQAFNAGNGVI